jgi:hypothetical protein
MIGSNTNVLVGTGGFLLYLPVKGFLWACISQNNEKNMFWLSSAMTPDERSVFHHNPIQDWTTIHSFWHDEKIRA